MNEEFLQTFEIKERTGQIRDEGYLSEQIVYSERKVGNFEEKFNIQYEYKIESSSLKGGILSHNRHKMGGLESSTYLIYTKEIFDELYKVLEKSHRFTETYKWDYNKNEWVKLLRTYDISQYKI